MAGKMWQLGSPQSIIYRLFDGLRMRLNRKLAGYLLDKAVNTDGAIVLEAGSGPAYTSSILALDQRVGLAVAMDIDPEALAEARRRDPSLALVVGDLTNLPFRAESIDLTWNSSTLEHLDDPIPALDEMARVTRCGGMLFVGVPCSSGPLGLQRCIPHTSVGVWIGETFNLGRLRRICCNAQTTPQHHIFYFFRFFVGVLARK